MSTSLISAWNCRLHADGIGNARRNRATALC
jgi:hypothetical protein